MKVKNIEVPYRQNWRGQEMLFDPDSSPLAWKHYKKIYTKINNIPDVDKDKDKDKYEKYGNDKKGYRLRCKVKLKNKDIEFEVAGDCSFNFNDKKRELFESIIEKKKDPAEKNRLIKKLNYCCEMHHTLYNFDLIPVTGGMNNVKGKLKHKGNKILVHGLGRKPETLHDRLDTFIHLMDYSISQRKKYEREKCNLKEIGSFFADSVFTHSLTGENFEILYELLENYNDVYEYLKDFYNIDDKKFIKKLINNGKSEIINSEDLDRYMNLADEFWELKKKICKV